MSPLLLLIAGVARGQDTERLRPHAWLLAEGGSDQLRAQVGGVFALRPEVALATVATATSDRLALSGGLTFEAGALDLMPLVGVEYDLETGVLGVAPELSAVGEVPPFPVYAEGWVRLDLERASGVWETRDLVLWTFARDLALGPELDLRHALGGAVTDRPVGARANVRLGRYMVLGVFAGIETVDLRFAARGTAEVAW